MGSNNRVTGKELRSSMNLIVSGITFGIVFFTVVNGPPLTGFTRALGASDLVYSVIMALPVIGSILQVFSSYILESTGKRKLLFLICCFIQRLAWIPIALVAIGSPNEGKTLKIAIVIFCITLSNSGGALGNIAYLSWLSDLIPLKIRGRFFGRRSMISTITGALASIAVGWFLDQFTGVSGFFTIFLIATVFGVLDIVVFFWVKDPPMKLAKERPKLVSLFAEPFRNKNFMRFCFFTAFWGFGLNLSQPFVNVYMLEFLKMDYFTISIISQFVPSACTILAIGRIGKLADRFGNKSILSVCCYVGMIIPVLWCFALSKNIWVVPVIFVLIGIFRAGFDLIAMSLSLQLAPEKNRTMYLAVYALIIAIFGTAIPYVCGGLLMELTGPAFAALKLTLFHTFRLENFHLLFALSSVICFIAFKSLFGRFEDDVERMTLPALFQRLVRGKSSFGA